MNAQVVLWDATLVMDDRDAAYESHYVTEVVQRSHKPANRARIVALRTEDAGVEVVAVGLSKPTGEVSTGKDRFRVEPIERITPLPIDEVRNALPSRVDLTMPPLLRPRTLTPEEGAAVLDALRRLSPQIANFLDLVAEQEVPVTGERGLRLREERDAIGQALELANIDPPASAVADAVGPEDTGLGSFFSPAAIHDIEDDLIAVDLRRFDADGRLNLINASAARFTSADFILTILNINRKPLEKVTGVDLIYWDKGAGAFNMVQYKRMTRRARGTSATQWAYTREEELRTALSRMQLDLQPRMAHAGGWRLNGLPYWFKFLHAEAFMLTDPVVLRGMYTPAAYLRLALEDDTLRTGPRGGFEVTYENLRYLTRGTFTDLVRKGMIGTTGRHTQEVLELVNFAGEEREAVFAVRHPRS